MRRTDDDSKPYLVWFQGRRTPVACRAETRSQAISKARDLKKRGGEKVVKVRQATEEEQKTAAKGKWIRTGPNNESPGYDRESKRGYGPKPKGYKGDGIESHPLIQLRLEGRSGAYVDGWKSI